MNAHELRLGNWIMFDGRPVKVFDLPYLVDDNKEGYLINQSWDDEYEPIPLTPEMLEKAGFVPTGLADFINGEIELWQVNNEFHFSVHDDYHISVNSVHQLQNLYFALTGEEIQINL